MLEKEAENKTLKPDLRWLLCLYFVCFFPILIGPIIDQWHDDLIEFVPYSWAYEKSLEFIGWADWFFETERPLRDEISDHNWYLRKFSRLSLFLAILILLFSKLVLKSKKLDADMAYKAKQWECLTEFEREKKKLLFAEWTFIAAVLTTALAQTDWYIFARYSNNLAFAYFEILAVGALIIAFWRMFLACCKPKH